MTNNPAAGFAGIGSSCSPDLGGVLAPERHHLPREMKKAGYTTAVVGKWHLRESPRFFDYFAVIAGHDPQLERAVQEAMRLLRTPGKAAENRGGSTVSSNPAMTNTTISSIRVKPDSCFMASPAPAFPARRVAGPLPHRTR